MVRLYVIHFLKTMQMKCNQVLLSGKKKMKNFWKRWQERKVRDPEVVGSITKIRSRQYPSPEAREFLRIGGKENRQITRVERVFMYILLARTYIDWLYGYKKIRKMAAVDVKKFEESESQLTERYVLIKSILLLVLLFLPMSRWFPIGVWVIGFFIFWEVIGLPVYPLTVLFVDRYAYDEKEAPPYCYWYTYSFNRSLLLLLWSYLETVIAFAYMYRHFDIVRYADCGKPITSGCDALYFSIVTITTLGYGDMRPFSGWGKFFASLEPIIGIVLLVVVVGLFFVEKTSKNNK